MILSQLLGLFFLMALQFVVFLSIKKQSEITRNIGIPIWKIPFTKIDRVKILLDKEDPSGILFIKYFRYYIHVMVCGVCSFPLVILLIVLEDISSR